MLSEFDLILNKGQLYGNVRFHWTGLMLHRSKFLGWDKRGSCDRWTLRAADDEERTIDNWGKGRIVGPRRGGEGDNDHRLLPPSPNRGPPGTGYFWATFWRDVVSNPEADDRRFSTSVSSSQAYGTMKPSGGSFLAGHGWRELALLLGWIGADLQSQMFQAIVDLNRNIFFLLFSSLKNPPYEQ